MANVNVIEFMTSVSDVNSNVSPTNLKLLQALTGLGYEYLVDIRNSYLHSINRAKWLRADTRLIKHLRLKPVHKNEAANFVHPVDTKLYKIPRPTIDPIASKKQASIYNHHVTLKFKLGKNRTTLLGPNPSTNWYMLNCTKDIVLINKRTPPKVIGKTVCMDVPDANTLAMYPLIKKPILRYENLGDPLMKVWILEKETLAVAYVFWGTTDTAGFGKTPAGAKLSYKAKIKKRVLSKLEGK